MANKIKYLLLLLVTFCCSMQSEADDGPVMNKEYTIDVPFSGSDSHNLSKDYFLSGATSVVVKLTQLSWATMRIGQWGNDNVIANGVSNSIFTYELKDTELEEAKNGNVYLQCEPASDSKLTIINKNADYVTPSAGDSGESGSSSVSYPQLTDIPTMYLEIYKLNSDGTTDRTQTETITTSGGTYHTAHIVIVDGNKTIKERNEETQIRGRGNSTWSSDGNKNPYRLKFPQKTKLLASYDANSNEINNYADAKSWTLMANKGDYSLIRNALSSELAKYIGMPFCPAYKFVDLVINGAYQGTYQISDQVQVGTKRVEVNSDTGWLLSGNRGGGYLEDPYFTTNGASINIKNPDADVTTESGETTDTKFSSMKTWMTEAIGKFSVSGDAEHNWQNYLDYDQLSNYFDMESLANYMIGIDITGDPDGAIDNIYMYKEASTSDKLKFGPMWDYDLAYGNADREHATSHFYYGNTDYGWGYMLSQLFNNSSFISTIWKRWQEIYNNGALTTYLINKVDALDAIIAKSQVKNFAAGKCSSVAGSKTYNTHTEAISALKTWISNHITWLNTQYKTEFKNITGIDPDACSHSYTAYTSNGDGTYSLACDKCGAAKSNSSIYYKYTVYPESSESEVVYSTTKITKSEELSVYDSSKPNTLVFVEAAAGISGKNVVADDNTCSNLVLTDGHPFYNPVKFTATTATYTRNVTQDYGAICLPYKVQNINSTTASFYALSSVSGANMMFSQTKSDGSAIGTGAYTPLLFKRKSSSVSSISVVSNNVVVKVSTTDKISDTVNGWTMRGVVSETSLTADNLYQISDATNGKIAKTNSITVSPFCAYLTNDTNTTTPLTITLQTATVSGDVNNDGKVDITDIIAVIAYLNNNTALANQSAADMDSSGTVTKDDLDALVQKVLTTK